MKLQCTRCRKVFTGKDEYEAEMGFNLHDCKVRGRSLEDLTDAELLLIINGEKTEDQIWNEKMKTNWVECVNVVED